MVRAGCCIIGFLTARWRPGSSLLKGWFFVSVTALVLGWVLNRLLRGIRRSAQQFEEHESRLRLIGDNLPDGFVYQYTVDPDGQPRFNYVSAGVERVLGVTPGQALGDARCIMDQLDPDQRPAYAAAEAESARTLTDAALDLRMRRPDGSVRLIHVQSRPSRDAEGRVRWDGIATDITERKLAEAALRESEKKHRTLFECSRDAILTIDPVSGKFTSCNSAAVKLFGLARALEFYQDAGVFVACGRGRGHRDPRPGTGHRPAGRGHRL